MFIGIGLIVVGLALGVTEPGLVLKTYGFSNPIIGVGLVTVLVDLVYHGNFDLALYLSYPTGFALAVLSDLESAPYITGVWGGMGLASGDFVEPLSMFAAAGGRIPPGGQTRGRGP